MIKQIINLDTEGERWGENVRPGDSGILLITRICSPTFRRQFTIV
jgi:hypothetical protein